MDSEGLVEKPRVPLLELMGVFFRVGVTSFGGSTAAWLYREIVERRGWLDEPHFLTALTLSQVLPGANPVNLAIYVGTQLRGGIGGAAAAFGMVGPAFCVILGLGYVYLHFGNSPTAHAVLGGLAAVGVGMTLYIGVKLARQVRKPLPIAIATIIFVTIGVLHWPMIPVVLVLTPLSIALARWSPWKGALMNESRLLGLILVFAPLSLMSFGGGQAIIADMQHQTVDVHHWMTGRQFVDLFALSRAAPGPSTLIAALIGWQVAGFAGAVVATLAIYIPSSIAVYGAVRWWHASKDSPWRGALERGLAPVAVGLVFAGAVAVLQAARVNELQIFTTVVSAGLLITTRIGVYTIMAAAAFIYALLQFL